MKPATKILIDALEDVTKELQAVYEIGVTYEIDPITEEGVKALREAQKLLAKHGRGEVPCL